MIDKILTAMKEQGYRVTKIRRAMLEILETEAKPLSAFDLVRKLAQKKLYPNKTTVYRELEALSLAGLVKEIQLGTRSRMYESTSLGHHHHLVCTKCESIEDISMGNDMMVCEKNITKKTSFKVLDHSLEFFGLCGSCK